MLEVLRGIESISTPLFFNKFLSLITNNMTEDVYGILAYNTALLQNNPEIR
jgi:hypothetical protein